MNKDIRAAMLGDHEAEKKPIWKSGESVVFRDYTDGTGSANIERWAAWVCPVCGWFVGEQYIPAFAKLRPHNQKKCNFCSQCGQKIDWKSVEEEQP